jgi:hypothetical protein
MSLPDVSWAASRRSKWYATTTTTTRELLHLLMGRNGETTRLPAGYTLDELRPNGVLTAVFMSIDPMGGSRSGRTIPPRLRA